MHPIPAYERDPRLTRLDTEVLATGEEPAGPFVVLADTVLYPEGGGQPADRGTLGGVEVLDVQKVERVIRHILAGPAPSGRVGVELDWARRFDHMQQHTGQHLLSAVARGRFGWRTTAFHLGARTCDIEIDTPDVTPEQLADLEEAVAVEIRAARSVRARRVSTEEYAGMQVVSRGLPEGHSGDVRLVEIEGIDINTCGGTHCASTSEIEAFKLLDTEPMRGGVRLSWVAGGRLRRLHEAHHRRNARLRELLGTADDELVSRTEAKLEQLKPAERTIRKLEEELSSTAAAVLVSEPGPVLSGHWPERDLSFLQRVAREAVRSAPDRVVFLTAGEGEAGAFVLAAGEATSVDLTAVGRRIAETLGGRGGGSGRVFQGRATEPSRRVEAVRILEGVVGEPDG